MTTRAGPPPLLLPTDAPAPSQDAPQPGAGFAADGHASSSSSVLLHVDTAATERPSAPDGTASAFSPIHAAAEADGAARAPAAADAAPDAQMHALVRSVDTLLRFVDEKEAWLRERRWDNLAHIEAFARALRFVATGAPLDAPRDAAAEASVDDAAPPTLLQHHVQPFERRALATALARLLPDAARPAHLMPVAADMLARARGRLLPGDLPHVSPCYTAHLATDVLGDLDGEGGAVVTPAQPGLFLVPRGVSPGHARGSAVLVRVLERSAAGGFACGVPEDARGAPDGPVHRFRTRPDGSPLLDVEGRPLPIVLSARALTAHVLHAGPFARGLDLRTEDDRLLLLTYAQHLKATELNGRSLFAWLNTENVARETRIAVVDGAVRAAFAAVQSLAIDPHRLSIALRSTDGDWTRAARAWLDSSGVARALEPRRAAHAVDAKVEASADGSVDAAPFALSFVWADAVALPGVCGGLLSVVAQGRAFARLVVSMLAPLGVLPLGGLRDARGDVLLQQILPPREGGADAPVLPLAMPRVASFAAGAILALPDAWDAGHGLALPDPQSGQRHDVSTLPAWLELFLDGATSTPPMPRAARSSLPPSRVAPGSSPPTAPRGVSLAPAPRVDASTADETGVRR